MKMLVRVLAVLILLAAPVSAQEYAGLSVSTDYPSVVTSGGDLVTFPIEVQNYGLPPQRVDLRLTREAEGWETAFVGGGRLVSAVFTAPDGKVDLELWLEPPADAEPGLYQFTIQATGRGQSFRLPITVEIGEALPQRLRLDPDLPRLRGAPDSDLEYEVELRNDSSQEALVNLQAQAPTGFEVAFEKQYGGQELTSLPIGAGDSETIKVVVTPSEDARAGTYPIMVRALSDRARAETRLEAELTGQPELRLTGEGGRLSGRAVAGREQSLTLTLENTGSADATDVQLTAREPANWTVEFDPEELPAVPPGETTEVTARVTPAQKAIAGDYVVNFRARGEGVSDSAEYRITVRTSTLWGIVAVLIIAAALVVVVFAVMRYGRR
jgi:uncharacterized membrane protein